MPQTYRSTPLCQKVLRVLIANVICCPPDESSPRLKYLWPVFKSMALKFADSEIEIAGTKPTRLSSLQPTDHISACYNKLVQKLYRRAHISLNLVTVAG